MSVLRNTTGQKWKCNNEGKKKTLLDRNTTPQSKHSAKSTVSSYKLGNKCYSW